MSAGNEIIKVPWKIWDAVYIFLLAFFLNILLSTLLTFTGIDVSNIAHQALLNISLPIFCLIAIFISIKYFYKVSIIETLGLFISKENLRLYISGGIFISILIFISSFLVEMGTRVITNNPVPNPYESFNAEQLKLIAVLAILIAPFFEEIFFRGFMQPAACQVIGNIPGVFFVSIVFTLIHQQYREYPSALLIIFILALIFGFSRLLFNSTIPGIIGHLINNLLAAMMVLSGNNV